jgi:hypothetical protein
MFTKKSRTITLQIPNKSTGKPPGAQLHMLTDISVKFPDLGQILFGLYTVKS